MQTRQTTQNRQGRVLGAGPIRRTGQAGKTQQRPYLTQRRGFSGLVAKLANLDLGTLIRVADDLEDYSGLHAALPVDTARATEIRRALAPLGVMHPATGRALLRRMIG